MQIQLTPVPDNANTENTPLEGGKFVMDLMNSRTIIHLAHLSATNEGSYATHKALEGYYTSIVDLIDRLVETSQGHYNRLMEYPQESVLTFSAPFDSVIYLEDLRQRTQLAIPNIEQPAIQNIVVEILELICSTLYKLRFLR